MIFMNPVVFNIMDLADKLNQTEKEDLSVDTEDKK